jgi:hypothetical protein
VVFKTTRNQQNKKPYTLNYLFSGNIFLYRVNNGLNCTGFTGLCIFNETGGYFISISCGLTGRFSKPPPQLGHTLCSTVSVQGLQKYIQKNKSLPKCCWPEGLYRSAHKQALFPT